MHLKQILLISSSLLGISHASFYESDLDARAMNFDGYELSARDAFAEPLGGPKGPYGEMHMGSTKQSTKGPKLSMSQINQQLSKQFQRRNADVLSDNDLFEIYARYAEPLGGPKGPYGESRTVSSKQSTKGPKLSMSQLNQQLSKQHQRRDADILSDNDLSFDLYARYANPDADADAEPCFLCGSPARAPSGSSNHGAKTKAAGSGSKAMFSMGGQQQPKRRSADADAEFDDFLELYAREAEAEAEAHSVLSTSSSSGTSGSSGSGARIPASELEAVIKQKLEQKLAQKLGSTGVGGGGGGGGSVFSQHGLSAFGTGGTLFGSPPVMRMGTGKGMEMSMGPGMKMEMGTAQPRRRDADPEPEAEPKFWDWVKDLKDKVAEKLAGRDEDGDE